VFFKVLAIEVSSLSDIAVFTTLPVPPSHINACCGEKMHAVVNHVAPVCQSHSMHAPRFLLRTELSHLHFYERSTSSQGAAVDGGDCAFNQVG
jgi:hypothetical protein